MKPAPPQQRRLFDTPATRLTALPRAIKCALRAAVEASGLSREEVVHRANLLAKESGTSLCGGNGGLGMPNFNKWLDLNSPHLPGTMAINVLCEVMQNYEALAVALEVHGLSIMWPEDQKYCALGRATHQLKEARQKLKKAEEQI